MKADLQIDTLPCNVDAERTLLGAVLLDNAAWPEIAIRLRPADFSLDSHRRIGSAMKRLADANSAIDIVTLANELDRYKEIDAVGGRSYLFSLTEGLPRRPVIDEYIRIVKDKSMLRSLIVLSSDAIRRAQDQSETALEITGDLAGEIEKLAEPAMQANKAPIQSHIVELMNRVAREYTEKTPRGIPTGNAWLDAKMGGGYRKGRYTIVAARPKVGKALRMDEPIKTPTGWKNNGDLRVGDELASVDGKPSFVTAIYPQGFRHMYSISFSDGRNIECDGEHLWLVRYRDWDNPRLLTTLQLVDKLSFKRYQKRLSIETASGDFGKDSELPLHPWLLGALIGDGGLTCKTSCKFTTADAWMVEKVRRTLPKGCEIKLESGYNYRIQGRHWTGAGSKRRLSSVVCDALDILGLRGVGSKEKFLPSLYLNSSLRSRRQLLRGLMDTDGSVEGKGNTLVFNTSSLRLAEDVQELCRSLGATAKIVSREAPRYAYKGEIQTGAKAYRVMISHRRCRNFVSLPRKLSKLQNDRRENRLVISSIVPAGIQEAQCITVSHPSELYIASHGYVVTHNTGMGVLSTAYNCRLGTRVVWFSLEMDHEEVELNLVPHVVDLPNIVVVKPELRTPEQQALVMQGLYTIGEWPLTIYDGDMDCDQICWAIDREARKDGDVLFVLDHFGLIAGGDRDIRKRYVENSERLRKKIKHHRNAALLNLFQLGEVPREFADKRPQPGDISESKKPLQDCFAMVLLHRYQDKETLKMTRKANINLALIRGGGSPGNVDGEFNPRRLSFEAEAELEYEGNEYYA